MTSNELATYGEQSIDLPAVETSSDALDSLVRQAKAMSAAHELGTAMAQTAMVPKHFQGKPGDCAAAILYGAELGLNAIQSLQNIMVINGKPGIEARTMVALVKKRGYRIETVESGPESVTVRGTAPSGETETSTWTMSRATTAGFTSNALYKKIPEQMLYAKAATEVCRKLAPDVLLGMPYSVEEMRLEPIQAKSERVAAPSRGVAGVRAKLGVAPEQEPASGFVEVARAEASTDAPAASPASAGERNDMLAILASVGHSTQDEVLGYVSEVLGRTVTGTKELTSDEVADVSQRVLAETEPPAGDL
ncbi:hypothetical protein ACWIDS_16350 [Dietzia maris]